MSYASDIAAQLKAAFPGVRVTSTDRTPAQQKALIAAGKTRATNSQHLNGNGIDIVLPTNVAPSEVRAWLGDQGINPGEFIPETGRGANQGTGAHLHIGLAPKGAAKGGGQSSGSDPASQVAAFRQARNAGPDVSQYPDIRDVLKTKLQQATPIPPEVIQAYNSHKMSDEDRAIVDKYVADGTWFAPKGQVLKAPPPRTAGELVGMGLRAAGEGLGSLIDAGREAAFNAIAPGTGTMVNKLLDASPLNAANQASGLADVAGAPKPESAGEKLGSAAISGGVQGLALGPAGVERSLANAGIDVASGAAAGLSQESARQAGAGPGGQLAAALIGGAVPIGSAAVAARIRAPKSLPEVVAETPRAAVIDDAGNLTEHGREVAARHNATPEEVAAAYEAPPSVQRGTANDQAPQVVAKEATTGQPVAEPIPEARPVEAAPEAPTTPIPPRPMEAPAAPDVIPATALERVQEGKSLGVDYSRGQATKSFDVQDAEQRLKNSNGPEGEQMRQFVARQVEQVKQAVSDFRSAFDDPSLTAEARGAQVQEAIRELRDNGQKGVAALYRQAKELGQEVPLDTAGIKAAYERLMVEADVPDQVKKVLTQEAARYGLIGEPVVIDKATGAVTGENKITRVKLDNGDVVAFHGEPETLRLDNAEDFRKKINAQYPVDGPTKLTSVIKSAIDDATEAAAEKLARYGQEGAAVPEALKAARSAHIEQVQTFKGKDIVQSIADWKKGAEGVTSVLKPEDVAQRALAKTSDLKRVKAVLLSKATPKSKAAWRALQAHGLAEVFSKATTRNTNAAGEITEAISGAKLRSEIERFGTDKLEVLLDPAQFGQLMKLRRVIEDVTVPITGTVNSSNSGNLMMRLIKDVDNQVTAAFGSAGFAVAGPAGGAIGGAIGRTISPAIKAVKEGKQAAETLTNATEYTAEQAAKDTAQGTAPKPSVASKAGQAVKGAASASIKAFIDTYASPRVLAPILAASEGQADATQPKSDPYAAFPLVSVGSSEKAKWDKRADGSDKGEGWLGLRRRPDGGVSSEISMDFGSGDIPTMVPGLTPEELKWLMTTPPEKAARTIPHSIAQKAIDWAAKRKAEGKSPFRQPNESIPYESRGGSQQ